jgi:hypothetical protein
MDYVSRVIDISADRHGQTKPRLRAFELQLLDVQLPASFNRAARSCRFDATQCIPHPCLASSLDAFPQARGRFTLFINLLASH